MSGAAKLLVSVRSVEEALAALAGGCDLLDIKEPSRGPLGMADPETIQAILETAHSHSPEIPVSAALGEANDWQDRDPPALPAGLAFVKLGCSGIGLEDDWQARWRAVRQRFSAGLGPETGWIAVAYADWQAATSPPPALLIPAAAAEGCRGILFDTFLKDGRPLGTWLPPALLLPMIDDAQQYGLFVAIAGGLRASDLKEAASLGPEIIAVRTAACDNGDRSGPVLAELVRELKLRLAGSVC